MRLRLREGRNKSETEIKGINCWSEDITFLFFVLFWSLPYLPKFGEPTRVRDGRDFWGR